MSMIVAVVGARERSSVKVPGMVNLRDDEKSLISTTDKKLVHHIIDNLQKKFGDSLSIVSYGCDDGIGILVKDRCTKDGPPVQFAEIIWYFHGEGRSKPVYNKFYAARNASLFEIADMFILMINRRRQSMLEDLFDRILAAQDEGNKRPVVAIDEFNKIVYTNMELEGTLEVTPAGIVIL